MRLLCSSLTRRDDVNKRNVRIINAAAIWLSRDCAIVRLCVFESNARCILERLRTFVSWAPKNSQFNSDRLFDSLKIAAGLIYCAQRGRLSSTPDVLEYTIRLMTLVRYEA